VAAIGRLVLYALALAYLVWLGATRRGSPAAGGGPARCDCAASLRHGLVGERFHGAERAAVHRAEATPPGLARGDGMRAC